MSKLIYPWTCTSHKSQ